MIQKIKSKRVELPPIYLIEDEEDYKQLPLGIPYIVGSTKELNFITVFLEFQVLLKSCKRTNLPLNWLNVLKKVGYNISKIKNYDLQSGGEYWSSGGGSNEVLKLDDIIEEQYVVNFDKLSELKILPSWLDDIKSSIEVNIINEVRFDPLAFSKQLGMNTGAASVQTNPKNLLILDVSGSIPNSIVIAITHLAKLMSKRFYADVIVTGGQTFFFDYDDVPKTDFVEEARKAGRSNEGEMYAAIIKEPKIYNTVISFGDNDSPQGYMDASKLICNFKVQNLYSLHTDAKSEKVTGYARIFKPEKTTIVKDWITTII